MYIGIIWEKFMQYYITRMSGFPEEKQKEFFAFLDKEKKGEYLSATNENRKKSILLSQGFAKDKIAETYSLDKKEIIFSVTPFGKPYCKSHKEIYFSLSHSGDFLALAIDDRDVGIDIEKIRAAKENLIDRVCCKNEKDRIFSSRNPDIEFTKIWTRKEAYLKALGTGIDRELVSIDTTDKNLKFTTETTEDFIVSVFCL